MSGGYGIRAALVAALALTGNAQASLYDRGGGLIYDDVLDVTWLQNASYFALQRAATSDNGEALIQRIISEVGTVAGHNLTAADFGTPSGKMTWWGAKAWAQSLDYLDPVTGITLEGWRLPYMVDTGSPGCDFSFSGTDCGFSVQTVSGSTVYSELAHMFYNNLGNEPFHQPDGSQNPDWTSVPSRTFEDATDGSMKSIYFIYPSYYWFGTEYDPSPDKALSFWALWHTQQHLDKVSDYYAWALYPGDVADVRAATVELPGTAWLLATAVLAAARLRRHRFQS